jgi:hypothetical protein
VGAGVAAAALLAAGVTASVVWGDDGGDRDDRAGGGSSPANGTSEAPQEPEPEPAPEPARYEDVTLPANDHLYFGQHPVAPRPSGSWNVPEIDFRYYTAAAPARLRTAEGNLMALLDGGRRGSLAACREDGPGDAEWIEMDRIAAGSQVCVRTDEGHVALVTIDGVDPGGDALTLDAAVWRDAL